jgi:hypothetical protein
MEAASGLSFGLIGGVILLTLPFPAPLLAPAAVFPWLWLRK